jgi:RimJ/RimL family protein N-acetyltransferase
VSAIPERIDLPTVSAALRRYRLEDIDSLYAAVEESRDHLRAFMPWADESRAQFETFVADAVEQWKSGADRNFLIVDPSTDEALGGCGLHARVGPEALEIGYWLRAGATGRGVITAAAGALTDAALAVDGVTRVEIHCDQANVRSAAVPRRLGYRLDRIEDDQVSATGDLGRSMIWVWPSGEPDARPRRSSHDATDSRP